MRNVKSAKKILVLVRFYAYLACCLYVFLFLIKLRWPKTKVIFLTKTSHLDSPWNRAGSDLESGALNCLFPTLLKKRQRTDDQRLHRNLSSFFVSDGGIKCARGTHAHISLMQCGYHLTSAHNRWDKYHIWAVQLELIATLTQNLSGLSRTKLSRAESMLSIRQYWKPHALHNCRSLQALKRRSWENQK